MTRPFNQQFHCPNCQTWQTAETLFGRWIRRQSELDSKAGYSVSDQDYWIHRYKIANDREFQLLMLVEIKTMGRSLSDAQTDTLHMANQIMRNRRQTPTKELRWQAGSSPLRAYSTFLGREIAVRAYGMHVLTFSGLGPDDSDVITWDKTNITEPQLVGLLKFDLDPDTLGPIDLRSHHQSVESSIGLFRDVREAS